MSKNNYNFESFIEKHKNTKSSFGNKIIIEKSEVKKHFRGFLVDSGLKKIIKTEFEKILFGFKNSFVVFEDGVVPSLPGTNGKKYSFEQVGDFTVKKTGFLTKGDWFDKNSIKVSLKVGGDFKIGTELFEEFQKLLNDPDPKIIESIKKDKENKEKERIIESDITVKKLVKSKKIDINQSIILQSVLELEEKYKSSNSYLTESELLKSSFLYEYEDGYTRLNFYRLSDDTYNLEQLKDDKIIFGFRSGIIFTKKGVSVLRGCGEHNYEILPFKFYFEPTIFNKNEFGINVNSFQHLNPYKNKNFYIDSLHYPIEDFDDISQYDLSLDDKFRLSVQDKEDSIEVFRLDLKDDELNFFKELLELIQVKQSVLNMILNEKESKRKKELSDSIKKTLSEFDKDGNGELDTVQIKDDFEKLVKKHQKKIIEIDRNYIQQFVKISQYQKLKRENLQTIFSSISNSNYKENLDETIELLKERIHSYELILFHSLCMVTCLVEDDMFTFYEIHESFDKLKIFKSDHEREVSEKLTNIEIGIYDLMSSIRSMERNVINELGYLSYVTQSSFHNLSESVTKQLSSIDSSIKFNNLLTGIQTHQTYKINQNTKSLRG